MSSKSDVGSDTDNNLFNNVQSNQSVPCIIMWSNTTSTEVLKTVEEKGAEEDNYYVN